MLQMLDLNLEKKRVLIRADLNVPIDQGKITSIKRIEAIIPTLKYALNQGAHVILMSHLGRPKEGVYDPAFSLQPVAHCLAQLLEREVPLIPNLDAIPDTFDLILLENIRFCPGEKQNDPKLSQRLANLCDIFVMDAFATAHRREASTYGVAEFAKVACAGPLLVAEISALQQIMKNPARPLVAIVGGSKVSTKLSILKNILTKVDCLILGGGIANTFLAAAGDNIGLSLYEPELVPQASEMLVFAKANNKKIPLPVDVVTSKEFNQQAKATIQTLDTLSDDMILDIGPDTQRINQEIIAQAKTIIWNGPLGVFEWDQFGEGTKSLASAIAASNAFSVAGGGDTLAAIDKYQVEKHISYISTGGGAFLEFLEGKQLPAIEILERTHQKVFICDEQK